MPAFAKVGNYAEWYWNTLTRGDDGETKAFHQRTYGADFRYQDFAPMFKAELFNATEWAELFRRSGARYIVPTSKHHEGFTMWPSAQSWNWNAVDIGPHRDLLGEIMQATRDAGLHAGMYFSLYEWFHPFYTSNVTKYVDEVLHPQWRDLIDNYKPDILWCDGEWEQVTPRSCTQRTARLTGESGLYCAIAQLMSSLLSMCMPLLVLEFHYVALARLHHVPVQRLARQGHHSHQRPLRQRHTQHTRRLLDSRVLFERVRP